MSATRMITSPDECITNAECVNDVIAKVARAQRGNVKRLAQVADIPHRTIESWLERESDGSYRRTPDADRLFRLMVHNDEVLSGVIALIHKQRATCPNPNKSKTS